MSRSVQEVLEDAMALTPAEREVVIDSLTNSLEDDAPLHPSWIVEAKRRLQEVQSGQVDAKPWEETMVRLRRILETP